MKEKKGVLTFSLLLSEKMVKGERRGVEGQRK